MNRWLLFACVMVLALGTLSAAVAGPDDDWTVFLRPRLSSGAVGTTGIFGTKTGASDGIDSNDIALPSMPTSEVFIACYDLGPQGYTKDIRAPLDWGQVKVWNLKLWLGTAPVPNQIILSGWSTGLNGLLPVRLEVLDPSMDYYFDYTQPGSQTAPACTFYFDGSLHQGIENAINVRLIAGPAVPEPASVAALVLGLVGTAGWVLRRRG